MVAGLPSRRMVLSLIVHSLLLALSKVADFYYGAVFCIVVAYVATLADEQVYMLYGLAQP